MYSNEKIKQLIKERDETISKLNYEIEKEIQKEKAKYKFSFKRLLLVLSIIIIPTITMKLNVKLFPKDSIFNWYYYIKK